MDFETKVNKIISKIGLVNNIIKGLNVIHVGLLGRPQDDKSENKIISVSEAIELSKGCVDVKGVITGKSEPSMVIVSRIGKCDNCDIEDSKIYNPPLLLPERSSRICAGCKERMSIDYEYEPSIKIRLRDEMY